MADWTENPSILPDDMVRVDNPSTDEVMIDITENPSRPNDTAMADTTENPSTSLTDTAMADTTEYPSTSLTDMAMADTTENTAIIPDQVNQAEQDADQEQSEDIGFLIEAPPEKRRKTKLRSSKIRAGDKQQEKPTSEEVAPGPAPEPAVSQHRYPKPNFNELFVLIDCDEVEAMILDTRYSCTLYTETNEPLYTGSKCNITFRLDRHLSYIHITFKTTDNREGYTEDVIQQAGLRFPHASLQVPAELKSLGDGFTHSDGIKDKRHCYQLLLPLAIPLMGIENVLVPNPPEELSTLKTYLCNAKTTMLRLKVHICTFADPRTVLRSIVALKKDMEQNGTNLPLARWRHPDKRQFIIQHNEFIPIACRPQPPYIMASRTTFLGWADYMICMCIGDLEEYEKSRAELEPYEANIQQIYLMRMPGQPKKGDRIYLGFLQNIEGAERLQEGQTMQLIHPETEDPMSCLHAVVTAPLPGVPVMFTTIYVIMRWDSETAEFDSGPFTINSDQILPLPTDLRPMNESQIKAVNPLDVNLKLSSSDKAYRHRVAALAALHERTLRYPGFDATTTQLLLGNDVDGVPKLDVFSEIREHSSTIDKCMNDLNEQQKEVFRLARQAPAGFVIVKGPPGTGKSHTATWLSLPFVIEGGGQSQVMCCSASNGCVDGNAVRMDEIIRKLEAWNGQYVVRAHAIETEIEIARQYGMRRRRTPENARPELVSQLGEDATDTLALMGMAAVVHEAYHKQQDKVIPFVKDTRVTWKGFRLSIGYRIMQLIKLIPKDVGDPRPPEDEEGNALLVSLAELYAKFAADVDLIKEEQDKLRELLSLARQLVIKRASYICTTPALACEAKIWSVCEKSVKALIFDEAGRNTEQEIISIVARYPVAVLKALIGDNQQLPPLVKTKGLGTYFEKQYRRSLLDRLMCAGIPYVHLTEQYRMSTDIRTVISNFGYQKKLTDNPCVKYESRPMAQAIRAWNKIHYGRERCLIYINVNFPENVKNKANICGTHVLTGGSRMNEVFVVLGINLAKAQMDLHPTATVAILTAYNAQSRLYLHAKTKLVREDKKYSQLQITTFDAAQGIEFDVVIVDFLLTRTAGHLSEHARINVGLSRARIALYVMASKTAIIESKTQSLLKVQSEILKIGTEAKAKPPFNSKYFTATDFELLTGIRSTRIGGPTDEPEAPADGETQAAVQGQTDGGWIDAVTEGQASGGWNNVVAEGQTGSGWEDNVAERQPRGGW